MADWVARPFGDLYLEPSRNGISAPTRVRGAGVRLVNMREIFSFDRIADQPMELAPIPGKDDSVWLLRAGDLLFARQSLVREGAGKVSYVVDVPRPTTFEGHIIRVRLDPMYASSAFYYYFFKSIVGREYMDTIVEQVAASGIRSSDLGRLQVPVPPLEEQRRIARVLGCLDDLIDSNRDQAAAVEERLALEFSRSGFDALPVDPIALSELIEVNPKLPKPTGDAPYIDMGALPTDSSRIAAVARRPARSGARFQNGDTLLARLTPCLENGKAAFVDVLSPGEIAVGSTEFLVLRDRGKVGKHWPYLLTRSQRFRDHAIQNMNGTSGRQRCSAEAIERYQVERPDEAALRRFRELAASSFEAIAGLNDEIGDLTRVRDQLLPLLMCGRVRVKDAA